MDIINEFHKAHRVDELCSYGYQEFRRSPIPAIECNDGFCISVQAHYGAYCSPRVTEDIEYFEFECGFPTDPVPELALYKDGDIDDRSTDTKSVYGYVPVEVIVKLIENHGGIKGAFDRTKDAELRARLAHEARDEKVERYESHDRETGIAKFGEL